MHCMLMDLLHGFEVLSTTEETLFNSRNVSRLVLDFSSALRDADDMLELCGEFVLDEKDLTVIPNLVK